MRPLLGGENEFLTAKQCGWATIANGELLRLAESEFDVFLTADQNIRYQQNLMGRSIAVLELSTNNLRRIQASLDLIRKALAELGPGDLRVLEIP